MTRRPKYVIKKELLEQAQLRLGTTMAEPEEAAAAAERVAQLAVELLDPEPYPPLPTLALTDDQVDDGENQAVCPGTDAGRSCDRELTLHLEEAATYRVDEWGKGGVLLIGKNWDVSSLDAMLRCEAGHEWSLPEAGIEHQ